MHHIALRAPPASMNGFEPIKRVNNHFLWYKEKPANGISV
jgi:hypothetical protein